jgi:4-hydroxy-3-methylbut-2-en-1-yl diphosphate reductase
MTPCILVFDSCNRLAVAKSAGLYDLPLQGPDLATLLPQLATLFPQSVPMRTLPCESTPPVTLHCTRANGPCTDPSIEFRTIGYLENARSALAPTLASALEALEPHLARIPYLHLGENDFIHRFRPEKDRNQTIYAQDADASRLYHSQLCEALKLVSRRQERAASAPVILDFGPVHYVLPSHFGFCLGVKNAIERAYETMLENRCRRIFMLAELIHNPFVNADLSQRGLRYLQTEKGRPYTIQNTIATGAPGERLWWDELTPDDIVIIPAFGATDEDKRRLVRKGIAVCRHDATCMLVEKVWKAARAYGREGFTVIIHGKHEHEETKATFSNTQQSGPAVIVRHLEEARLLGRIVATDSPEERAQFYTTFAGRYTPGFDVNRDLERIAVVNQTTLLMNETVAIIEHLRDVYQAKYGDPDRVGGKQRRDTLCYATQVNQDALSRALQEPLDAALVIGGKNSSNTYQLYRLCADQLGDHAHFIQSEACLHPPGRVAHYVFPYGNQAGHTQERELWSGQDGEPKRILITGGASCPDGIIQQVIAKMNQFFPAERLRPMECVLADLKALQQ